MTTGEFVLDLRMTETDDGLTFAVGDAQLVDYVARPADVRLESPRPYFSPVRTLRGEVVTDFRPADHVWHRGISWSLPVVGDENFWGGPTYLRDQGYVQLPNNGTQQHLSFDRLEIAPDCRSASVVERLLWSTEAGRELFDETRRISVALLDDTAWALTFDTTMTNLTPDPIPLGSPTTRGRPDAGYGGLFWRGPESFRGGRVLAPLGGPAAPAHAADVLRGTRAPWLGFAGEHPSGRTSTVVMVDAPGNPRHPTPWFVRSTDYAGLCPAPFFHDEWVVAPGAAFRARYAVVVADGDHDAAAASLLAEAGLATLESSRISGDS